MVLPVSGLCSLCPHCLERAPFSIPLHQLMDMWIDSTFRLPWIILLWTFVGRLLKDCFFFFFFSVTALFYLEDSRRIQDLKRREWRSAWGGRERERERERERACTWERDSKRKRFGSSSYMFFLPPGPALGKLGLARSAVCSVCPVWSLHSGPQTFLVF